MISIKIHSDQVPHHQLSKLTCQVSQSLISMIRSNGVIRQSTNPDE